jgi:hypothetical protein
VLTPAERTELVAELATRPGHEKVRALLHRLLVDGLGADSRDIDFERPVPEVHGRIDALLGRTVFELKSDLGRERGDAEEGLTRYLTEREGQTGERYVGIATDGADFIACFLKDGSVVEVDACRTDPAAPQELLAWLQGAVATGDSLPPDPDTITREFGRNSLAARRALDDLGRLWATLGATPEARLKRKLWEDLLGLAYGAQVSDDALFLQHTYLAVVAKAVAWAALIETPAQNAEDLLHGAAFTDAGISGQSEPDFFDWPLADLPDGEAGAAGKDLMLRISRHVNRFRLRDIRMDILKALYESLIDPDTRHDLGEYYTPDWLAARMVAATVDAPLEQRVMDPACGSGTFLFHLVRAVLAAAETAGLPPAAAARKAVDKVAGIDIHPVAVIFARVTYLLALMPALRAEHPGDITLPVYLGNALQWDLTQPADKGDQPDFLASDEMLEIFVPAIEATEPQPQRLPPATLRFPTAVAADALLFDRILNNMIRFGERSESSANFAAWMDREAAASPACLLRQADRLVLRETYGVMRRLQGEGRNHIWGYVAHNLARPVWLASEAQKADVVIGNPPWVSYRYMSGAFKKRFRNECHAAGLWVGGKVATQQDLAGYFHLRAASLYLRRTGRMALVMPYAALSRQAWALFRKAEVKRAGQVEFRLRFTAAWTFGPEVQPLFPVPSCVLFAEVHDASAVAPLPARVQAFTGTLPRRNASAREADAQLSETTAPWPAEASSQSESPYRRLFRQGATLVPRRLVLVEPAPMPGMLPPNPEFPIIRGRTGTQDKAPWKTVEPPQGRIRKDFLYPVLLGESVAPFRILMAQQAVIPWDVEGHGTNLDLNLEAGAAPRQQLMDAKMAGARGHLELAQWLEKTEALWERHKRSPISLLEQCDYYGKLSCQFPPAAIRVVYTKAGTNLAACAIQESTAIVDHKLYWAAVDGMTEARYLCAVLNSEVLRSGVERFQAQGQWGARDFDKYVFNLPIPRLDASNALHGELAQAATTAEDIANAVEARADEHFTRARARVRSALAEHGVAARLERLVGEVFRSG